MKLAHPAYPFNTTDKFLKDNSYLVFCLKIFFQKVIHSKDRLLIRETCFFISNLLGDFDAIEKFDYTPDFFEKENFFKKKFSNLYSNISLFFKQGVTQVNPYLGNNKIEDIYSDYEKFKLGLEENYNVWEILEDLKKMKKILKEILVNEKKLEKEIDKFKKLANDEEFLELMESQNKVKKGGKFEENLKNLIAFKEIFNSKSLSNLLIILESFINDINGVVLKIDDEKKFKDCQESLMNFCYTYAPLTKKLKKYCQCVINGAN